MRRFFTTSFITLALVISAVGAAPTAHAQTCPTGYDYDENAGCQPIQTGAETCAYGYQYDATAGCIPAETTAGTPIDPAAAGTPTSLTGPATPEFSFNGIMVFIASLFAWLLGVAAITLDNAVFYTVVTMGSYVKDLTGVGIAWRVLRDIGNIVLIFGFLAIGITTILNVDWYGGGKKMLPMLFVAAVFLNFSLFISEAVIDTGNLFATQFYTQINGGNPAGKKNFDLVSVKDEGISGKIMSQLGLQTIYGAALNPDDAKRLFQNSALIGFMSIFLFLIAAFVFFTLAFILIARFVILLFLIIIAPIGFAGLAIPQMKGTADKWWHALFEQTITAPVLLLLLYIALLVITDAKFITGFGSDVKFNWTGFIPKTGETTNYTGFAGLVLTFLVAMGLLLAVVIISKKLSAFGAAGATKLAGKLSFGATAWAGRTSVGWGGKKFANLSRRVGLARVPIIGTGITRGLDRVASASFDMRGVAMGGGLKGMGIDAGEAQKGGYKADLKARTESRTKYASELTGRELTDEEKVKQLVLQNQIKAAQKARAKSTDPAEIERLDKGLKVLEKDLEDIESVTDKGAQRKYAGNLQLDYLGLEPKGVFNTYFNFAANTEAAKIIRSTAKKGKPDKDFSTNMKNLLKEAAAETGEEAEAGAGAPGAGGASTTPPAGHTESSGGIFVPSGSGGGPRP